MRLTCSLAAACLLAAPRPGLAQPLELVGLPVALPAAPSPVERFAAGELARYLEKITGRKFESTSGLPQAGFVLGRAPAERLGVKFTPESYGEDGFLVRREGNRILLAGISGRGTLYAVYAFLERLGCRFFAPDFDFYAPAGGEFIPRAEAPRIDALDAIEKPSFPWRKKYVEEGISHNTQNLKQMIDWMAKARLNVFDCPIDYQHHGKTRWDNWRGELIPELAKRGLLIEVGGHGYPNFLPQDRYFDQHPDWFGTINGQRSRRENVVFATSNPEAVATFIANIKTYLRAHPEIDIFDCWPPDGARWSDAPEDVALGSPTERQMRLLSEVTRELRRDFPRLRVQFIAYASYLAPPEKNRPPEGLVMEFCPITRSFEAPLFDPSREVNAGYFADLEQWIHGIIQPRAVTIYSYVPRYAWRSLPYLIPHMIAAESRRYHGMSLGGWAGYSEPGAWATFELDHYFMARCAWNAELDPDRELADYTAARYGAAAKPVSAYLRLVEEVVPHAAPIPPVSPDGDQLKRWSQQFGAAAKLLAEARRLAGADAALAVLLDKLEGSRRYADNEIRLRLAMLGAAAGSGQYKLIGKLLAEREEIVAEYAAKGVILRDQRVQ